MSRNMPPTKPRLNSSDWEMAVGRERESRSFVADATALDVLRQRFRDISARTREHRHSSWIYRPGFAVLRKVSDSALELTRLAFQELSQFDNPAASTIPLHSLSQLLMENQTRLGEIDRRLNRLQSLVNIAEHLREPLEQLIGSTARPFGPWDALIRELLASEVCRATDGIDAMSAADLENFLESESWPQAWFYLPAIHRAVWTATLARDFPELQPYPVDVLLLPSVLADCGLLIQFPERGRTIAKAPSPASPDYQRHPEISAALLSMIEHVSPLSSLLAGQHHERLDGRGYPRRLRLHDLNSVSRCFSVIARWSELMLSFTAANTAADPRVEAARTLVREAWNGSLDTPIVKRLLAAVDADAPAQSAVASRQESSFPDASFDEPSANPPAPSTENSSLLRFIDGPETLPPPAMLSSRVPAFKEDGPSARPTPPPRPAVSGYR